MTHLLEQWKKRLGTSAAHWVLGYFAVLACGVGVVYYWRVAYAFGLLSAGTATLVVCAAFSAVYLLVFLCAHFLRQKFALKAAVLIVLAGLCFGAANPPLQTPDETMHFLRAYSLGSGNFMFDQHEQYPADVNELVRSFSGSYIRQGEGGLAGSYARYRAALAAGDAAPNANTDVQQAVAYLPQAAGVAVGRLLGGDALVCMYLARAFNLLFYAAACGAALYMAGRFKAILVALMLCPVSLFMAASCSADSMFLGLTWAFIGACLSPVVTKKRMAALALSFGAIFYIKFTALALLPLVFLLPWDARPGRLSHGSRLRGGALCAGLCAVSAAALYALQTAYVSLASNYRGLAYADPGIRPADQMAFIFSNIPRYIAVFCYSLYRDKANLFSIGVFGWMDMIVPFVSYFSPVVLLFAAGFSALEGAREPRRTGWLMALCALLLYGFTYTGMYLTSTPYTLPEINGVQTRYLLGAFFALLVLAAMCMGRTMALQELREGAPQKTPPAWRMLHIAFCYAVVCALLLFQSYYIGA